MIPKESYYSIRAISNSSLKLIDPTDGGSPQKFKDFIDGNLQEDSSQALINGTLVHLMILEPEKFDIAALEKPTATIGEMADYILQQDISISDQNLAAVFEAFGWQPKWKPDTRLNNFKKSGALEYIEYMRDTVNSGKIAIDQNSGVILTKCKEAVEMNSTAMFLLEHVTNDKHIEAHNELEVVWEHKITHHNRKFKAKLDRLIIDHSDKTFSIVDLKTTSKTIGEFQQSFEKFNYDRQIAFYVGAAKNWLRQNGLKGYKFESAFIIACETTGYGSSQVFDVTNYYEQGKAKVTDLVRRVDFHYNQNNWIQQMESIEGHGCIKLNPKTQAEVRI